MTGQYVPPTREGDEEVVRQMCEALGVSVAEMRRRWKIARLVICRQAMFKYLRQECGWTLERIGQALGRDHASVIYGIRRMDDLMSVGDYEAMLTYATLKRKMKRQPDADGQ